MTEYEIAVAALRVAAGKHTGAAKASNAALRHEEHPVIVDDLRLEFRDAREKLEAASARVTELEDGELARRVAMTGFLPTA